MLRFYETNLSLFPLWRSRYGFVESVVTHSFNKTKYLYGEVLPFLTGLLNYVSGLIFSYLIGSIR